MQQQSYYDIDAILAEEELVPCTTLFEFSHLAGLDPDGAHHRQQHAHQKQDNDHEDYESSAYLPENSRIKIPLWAVETWAQLGFVRLQLPRHYGRRARERYDADPGDANLRYVSSCCVVLFRLVSSVKRLFVHPAVAIVVVIPFDLL